MYNENWTDPRYFFASKFSGIDYFNEPLSDLFDIWL